MTVSVNNRILSLPSHISTLAELLDWQDIPSNAVVTLNGHIMGRKSATVKTLQQGDRVMTAPTSTTCH